MQAVWRSYNIRKKLASGSSWWGELFMSIFSLVAVVIYLRLIQIIVYNPIQKKKRQGNLLVSLHLLVLLLRQNLGFFHHHVGKNIKMSLVTLITTTKFRDNSSGKSHRNFQQAATCSSQHYQRPLALYGNQLMMKLLEIYIITIP